MEGVFLGSDVTGGKVDVHSGESWGITGQEARHFPLCFHASDMDFVERNIRL